MNNKEKTYLITLCIAVFVMLSSCNNKKNTSVGGDGNNKESSLSHENLENTKQNVTAKEFATWCANTENNLNKSKDISELKYTLSYMPMESMALLELRSDQYDYDKFRKTCVNYSEMTYFTLKIELPNGSGELLKHDLRSPSQYDSRVKYTSFDMQNDLYLIQGIDTLRPGLYQCERIFEVAPYLKTMLAFDNKKFDRNKELTIVFNDRLFEKGYIKFNYKNRQLTDVPTITGL